MIMNLVNMIIGDIVPLAKRGGEEECIPIGSDILNETETQLGMGSWKPCGQYHVGALPAHSIDVGLYRTILASGSRPHHRGTPCTTFMALDFLFEPPHMWCGTPPPSIHPQAELRKGTTMARVPVNVRLPRTGVDHVVLWIACRSVLECCG
jgi:hypothetical protein